jgi:transposase
MIQLTPHMRVLVATHPVDFRKGIDGLVRICYDHLNADPFSGTIFVFRNRSRTGLKILVYDGQGYWLCHKRLSKGRFRWWPNSGAKSSELKTFFMQVLMAAGNPERAECAEQWKPLPLPENKLTPEAGVPGNAPIIYSRGKNHIQREDDHNKGCGLHKKTDRQIPGIK